MLPIFRLTSVGGVLLAILILVLALNPPDGPRLPLLPAEMRGALLRRNEHPEWRQLLILAALQRADEIRRLRDLPDTPTIETTLPVDIGERSSTELPVTKGEELPPPVTPARIKSQNESRIKERHRRRHVRLAVKPSSDPFDPTNSAAAAGNGPIAANSDHFIGPPYPEGPNGAATQTPSFR
ncbi:MAG TPA: hypothetical protein VFE47_06635 [Tepidisphaeraceae bacterium]|jgi:hypothetical protein|nr:hypothetical protein [Tepidisphaeraceae bacterium]